MLARFKRDYFSYLLGILVPALVNFLTIPFFKNLLGQGNFGIYTFYFSILLIINSSFSGGITQSIIRLHIDYKSQNTFYYLALWIGVLITSVASVFLFLYLAFSQDDYIFSVLFILALLLANLYTTLLAITQANLLSKIMVISETVRTILFLGLSIILLYFLPSISFLKAIFFSICISYGAGLLFIFGKNKLKVREWIQGFDKVGILTLTKEISKYGGFLLGWFLLYYGITMGNRFILAHFLGKEGIGHFTASFDMLNKSIVLLFAPLLTSLFPLIVKAYAHKEHKQVKELIRKLTFIELALLILTFFAFVFFGFQILSTIIQTPETNEYFWIDVQVILGTFIWQLAMLQHKFLELEKKTHIMLMCIFCAFCISIVTDLFFIANYGVQYASMGFLAGGFIYLIAVFYNNHFNKMAIVTNVSDS